MVSINTQCSYPCVGILISNLNCDKNLGAIFFAAYETSKEVLREKNRYFENQLANQMLAGACAEFSSCCFKVPFEVVKVNSQTSIESNMQIIRTIVRKEGPMGMYRGFVSTAIRDIPFALLQMPIWEQLKGYHRIKYKEAADAKWSAFYGSISGAISGLLTTPLDVAKTRIMCDDSQNNSRYQVPNALKLIWKEEKLKGLFSGGLTRMAWIALGGGLFFGAYEQALIFLN